MYFFEAFWGVFLMYFLKHFGLRVAKGSFLKTFSRKLFKLLNIFSLNSFSKFLRKKISFEFGIVIECILEQDGFHRKYFAKINEIPQAIYIYIYIYF